MAGVAVKTPSGVMTAKAIVLNCAVDLPARALVCNMKQWNGCNGCLYCEKEGTTLPGDHLHRYWPYRSVPVMRSHTSLLHNAQIATATQTCVKYIHVYMCI